MLAADANIEVARARLMPSIDLASQIGYTGTSSRDSCSLRILLQGTILPLVVAIFDGVRKTERTFAQSYYDEMVITYRKTILQAVRGSRVRKQGPHQDVDTKRRPWLCNPHSRY